VIDGPFKNRTTFDRFNLWNKSEKARKIAEQQFKKVCEAVNVMKPADSSVLHMKPLMIKLSVKEYNGNDSNEVKGYKACLPQSSPATTTTLEKPKQW
jgi:hypothetical protein